MRALSFIMGLLVVFMAELTWAQKIAWQKTFGGAACTHARFVRQTSDGGYILAGGIGTWPGDIWLIKTDAKGNRLWDRSFGGSNNEVAYAVLQTPDGGYILTCMTETFGAGWADIWLIKTDTEGNKLWARTFGGPYRDGGHSIYQTSDGGYIIAGVTGHHWTTEGDVWLIKTDAEGNKLWERTFGGPNTQATDMAHSVKQTSDGGYILAGFTESYGAGGKDIWLIKTDSEGNKLWDRTFGGSATDRAFSVQQTSDGGYIIVGFTESYGAGAQDIWLIKTDGQGNKLWEQIFGGPNRDEAYSVQQTSDGGYIIAGLTDSFGAGGLDVWVIKTDAGGQKEWDLTIGSSKDDAANCIQQTSDGGYIVAGWTGDWGSDTDVLLVKIYEGGTSLRIPTLSARPGDTLTVPILVNDASEIAGAEMVVTYDPEVLTALEVKTTDLTRDFSIADSVSQGKVAITLASGEGISEGSGSLVDIVFRVVGFTGDSTSLVLKKAKLYDEGTNPISVETEDGKVRVAGLKADVNGDGVIDVRDAILCLRISAGLSIPEDLDEGYAIWAADVNEDGKVRSGDALLILYRVLERLIADPKLVAGAVQEAVVRLGEVEKFGNEVTVPVLVEGPAYAGDIELSYDSSVLSLVEVKAGAQGSLMAVNRGERGRLRVSLVNSEGIVSFGGEVLRLRFRARGDVTGGVNLERVEMYDVFGRDMRVELDRGIYGLIESYPNPFNSRVGIRYRAVGARDVKLGVYDIRGRLVRELVEGGDAEDEVEWDGRDMFGRQVSSGVYVVRLKAEGGTWVRKVVLVR